MGLAHADGVPWHADFLQHLRAVEKEKGIKPDPDLDAYLKASAIQGKLFSASTQYVMRLLGLEVCPLTIQCDLEVLLSTGKAHIECCMICRI